MSKLKSCRFCKGEDLEAVQERYFGYFVWCYSCYATGPTGKTPEEAKKLWNRREK